MKRFIALRSALIISLLLCTITLIHATPHSDGINVVMLLDDSGSMKKNDPKRLSLQAAKLFVSLLNQQDHVSIIGFSHTASKLTPLLSLKTQKNETKIFETLAKLKNRGTHTNIYEALVKGHHVLSETASNKKKVIILMSDGKMDMGNAQQDLDLTDKTLSEITPQLKQDNIAVYSIAFSNQSNIPLLKLIAEDTEGQFNLLQNPNDFHTVFANIFESSKSPDMLPLSDDSFVVDEAINEITIVATKFKPSALISLETPTGEKFSLQSHPNSVRWFSAQRFDLITLTQPTPGYWLIKFSEGGNKAYIVTHLKLMIHSPTESLQPNTSFKIEATLIRDEKTRLTPELLDSTRLSATVTSPKGQQQNYPLHDNGSQGDTRIHDGRYTTELSLQQEGTYKIAVIAKSETFDRQKTVFVTIKIPESNQPFKVLDATDKEKPEQPHADKATNTLVIAKPKLSSEMHDHADKIMIEDDIIEEETIESEHETNTIEPESGKSNLLSIILIFGVLNIIGISIAGIVHIVRQRQKTKQRLMDEEEDQDESEEKDNEDESEITDPETATEVSLDTLDIDDLSEQDAA